MGLNPFEKKRGPLDHLAHPYLRPAYRDLLDALPQQDTDQRILDDVDQILQHDPELKLALGYPALEKQWERIGQRLYDLLLHTDQPELQQRSQELLAKLATTIAENSRSLVDAQLTQAVNAVDWDQFHQQPPVSAEHERIQQLFERIFANYQLDFYQTWQAWSDSLSGSEKQKGVPAKVSRRLYSATCFHALRNLEHAQPGIAKVLRDEFGILVYGRYPEEVLLNQFQERNDTALPYGIAVVAYDDHNASIYQEKDFFAELANQSAGHMRLRIIECKGKRDLYKRCQQFEQRYQQGASFAVVAAHGSREGVLLDRASSDGEISLADVIHPSYQKAQERFLKPGASIIMAGCELGRDEGMAEAMAKASNVTVHAARHLISKVASVKMLLRGDQPPAFKVKFGSRVVGLNIPGRVMTSQQS